MSEMEPKKCKHDGGFRYEDPGPFSDDIVLKICNLCERDVLDEDLRAAVQIANLQQGTWPFDPPPVVGGGDYCFEHEWSVLAKGPCPRCVPYFGRDLPALIDVLTTYAKGNGANGCNLNTQEAEKIARILTSHVYG